MANKCWHCGEPLGKTPAAVAEIAGERRAFCCEGCAALAETLTSLAPAAPAPEPVAIEERRYLFVRGELATVTLALGNVHCGACTARFEQSLSALPGVVSVRADLTTRRGSVTFHRGQVSLAAVLATAAEAGFEPRPVSIGTRSEPDRQEYRVALKQLLVAGFGTMQVMTYSVGVYFGKFEGIEPLYERFFLLVSLLVSTWVVAYSGVPFYAAALRDARRGQLGMDVPVSVAILIAYFASAISVLWGAGELFYFDSAVMFIFFLSIARFIEASIRQRALARQSVLVEALPETVCVRRGDQSVTLAVDELRYGDLVELAEGAVAPADGRVRGGVAYLDEALLTGESRAIRKSGDDLILAGSRNAGAPFVLEVTRLGRDTALAHIEHLVQTAAPPPAGVLQLVARYFVVGVLLLAAAGFAYWWQVEPERAFGVALAVLVVSCPCALSLARPAALIAASHRLSRAGIVVARLGALEALCKARYWLFDKTGTLTTGATSVQVARPVGAISTERARAVAAALEADVSHTIAAAFAERRGELEAEDVVVTPGCGVSGRVDEVEYRLGAPDWIAQWHPRYCASGERSVVVLASRAEVLCEFELADALRPDAAGVIRDLRAAGARCEIVSGDAAAPVAKVAQTLGIERYHSRCLPADKLLYLQSLQEGGASVAMVGDGINDAPVLRAADVSISLGNASHLAQCAADLVILNNRLDGLLLARASARRALQITRQNIVWALGYNVLAVPLALGGQLTPWAASIGMALSSLLVVVNAARANRPESEPTPIEPAEEAVPLWK